jgi:hypothetical protein
VGWTEDLIEEENRAGPFRVLKYPGQVLFRLADVLGDHPREVDAL